MTHTQHASSIHEQHAQAQSELGRKKTPEALIREMVETMARNYAYTSDTQREKNYTDQTFLSFINGLKIPQPDKEKYKVLYNERKTYHQGVRAGISLEAKAESHPVHSRS